MCTGYQVRCESCGSFSDRFEASCVAAASGPQHCYQKKVSGVKQVPGPCGQCPTPFQRSASLKAVADAAKRSQMRVAARS